MAFPAPESLPALSAVADSYDVVLCDVWGVIHDGVRSFPAACEALQRFRETTGPVVLISNSPRPWDDVVHQLDSLGVPRAAWGAFVTSGDVTRDELAKAAPGPAWAISAKRESTIYDGLGMTFAGPEDAAFISCTGLTNDDYETPEDYRDALSIAAARKIPMICANPDKVVQRGETLIWCAGALADLYLELGGGPVTIAGKPAAAIYDRTLAEATRLLGRPVDRSRVLCIGDGLPTDVKGANDQGLDLLYVAAGIHAAEALDASGALDPLGVSEMLERAGAHARYATAELRW
ncbi:TIGR01459 family HAD-type hydrolase [soil metagenome]